MQSGPISRRRSRRALAWLAALAYLPLLLSHPGRLPADTKLGLTLDPARLMATSVHSWDTSQFAGWVPHQAISYLWPSGPFYWSLTSLGLPEWVVQRLWVGTVLFLGGAGIWWFVRRRGYSVGAAVVAALIYQLSPYILPYASRTSLMLLPWAGLGWLMGLADRAAEPGRDWRRPTALFGLVIATVGGINLTAIAMVAPAPLLLLVEAARRRDTSVRRAVLTAARLGGVSLLGSLWWMSMLAIQGRYGAKVLGYSETLEAVSATSTAPEVLRGSGYWLSYVHPAAGPNTTAAMRHMTSPWLIAVSFLLLGACLLALVLVRFAERALAALLVAAGLVLAVGVHPITDASPLMSGIADASRSTLALSMRSSTRAVPMLLLGLGLCAAALVDALAVHRVRWRALAAPVFVVLAVANQPALLTRQLVDPGLLHDQSPPSEWITAARWLDAGDAEQRVLQLPGVEFQVFSWGYTVDPPLAWLTDRPLITRDLLPLGSPAAMDLLYAFDDRFQNATVETDGVAPVLRFLGADTVWLARDTDSAYFGAVSPDEVGAVLDATPDLAIGGVNGDHVTLYHLDDPAPITRAATRTVILYGSGDGLVDAAAAGLLDGHEAVLYAADLTDDELAQWVEAGATVLLTDTNRDRAHQWRGSQDVWGFTETGGPGGDVLRFDAQDARFPVFAEERAADQTVATLDGGLVVKATSYGSPVRYLPARRPAMAVDGDPYTAWTVGVDGGPTVGEQLRLSAADGLLVVQPSGTARITRIGIDDADGHRSVELTTASSTADGQAVAATGEVTITIETVSEPGEVGFAEVLPEPHPETVRTPVLRAAPADGPFGVVLTRLADQEIALRRAFTTPDLPTPEWSVSVRFGGIMGAGSQATAGCSDGLVALDGVPVPLQITAQDAAALSAGGTATLHACGQVAPIGAGDHLLTDTAMGGLAVERVVLGSGLDTPGPAAIPSVTIARDGDTHTVTLGDCPDGCWLVFGEGYSEGWSATSADATVGRHVQISGGFNGWWITPDADGAATIALHWAGQRPIWIALAVSAVAILLLLVASFWRLPTVERRPRVATPVLIGLGGREPWRRTVPAAIVAVVAVAVAVSPHTAMWCLVPAALAVGLRRTRVLALIGALGVVATGLRIALLQWQQHYDPGFLWPITFEAWHTRAFAAALLVTIAAAVGRDRERAR